MKCWDANLYVYEKNSFIHSPSCIVPSIFKSWLLLLKTLWNCASKIYFRKFLKVVLLVIYQFNYDFSMSTSFIDVDIFKTFWKTKNCSAKGVSKISSGHVLKTNKHLLGNNIPILSKSNFRIILRRIIFRIYYVMLLKDAVIFKFL